MKMLITREKLQKNIWTILTWGIVAFFGLLYISLIFNQNVWTDEVFTFKLLKNDIPGIIQGTAVDVHPPLYYFYAKLFECIWPQNIQAQKIAAIIPMLATLSYLAVKVKKWFGDLAAFFTLLFLTCIPCTMEFAVQIRMYSLALLFVSIAGISAYEVAKGKGVAAYIWLVVGSVGAAYTHYFAFVSICFVNAILLLYILFKYRVALKKYCVSIAAMIALYVPWMPYMYTQVTRVRADYWIAPITAETVWSYFVWTFGLDLIPGFEYLYIAILGGLCICTFIFIKKDKKAIAAALYLLIPVLTAVSGVLISLTKSPIYRDQYVMPALGTLAIFVGLAVATLIENVGKGRLRLGIVGAISLFLLLSGAVQYKECYRQEYKSTYIDKTMEWYRNEVGENDYILYNLKPMGFVYDYYFSNSRLVYVEDFDLGCEYDNAWFLCSPECWPVTQNDLINYDLWMEHCGWYGIEHSEYDLFKITHNSP